MECRYSGKGIFYTIPFILSVPGTLRPFPSLDNMKIFSAPRGALYLVFCLPLNLIYQFPMASLCFWVLSQILASQKACSHPLYNCSTVILCQIPPLFLLYLFQSAFYFLEVVDFFSFSLLNLQNPE